MQRYTLINRKKKLPFENCKKSYLLKIETQKLHFVIDFQVLHKNYYDKTFTKFAKTLKKVLTTY